MAYMKEMSVETKEMINKSLSSTISKFRLLGYSAHMSTVLGLEETNLFMIEQGKRFKIYTREYYERRAKHRSVTGFKTS